MLDIAVIIFAYSRDKHLKNVLEGLKNNPGVKELYIFQDGLKSEYDREAWQNTSILIKGIDWCKVNYKLADVNKGLANSIVDGIDHVFNEKDAVIVLEDDCVPTENFYDFMQQNLEKYKNNRQIYSVSGYAWPIELEKEKEDIYFCGRISSWGWGTWKDRWENFERDKDVLRRIKSDRKKSKNLTLWGADLEQMFIDNLARKNDSWAVYWALYVIENEGMCVAPYYSLISNIGLDGTGVHCGISDKFESKMESNKKSVFTLPEKINILNNTKKAFAELYGSYTASNEETEKEHVLIYGLGNFFKQYEKQINQQYYVEAVIDNGKKGFYAGKNIVKCNEVKKYKNVKILIMIHSIQQCINVAKELIFKYDMNYKNILLGHNLFGYYVDKYDSLEITESGKVKLKKGGICISVSSEDEFHNVHEVLVDENYDYYINNHRQDIIIDIGMNIGDATLYFLNNKKVKKVYAYEPFKITYEAACENLEEFMKDNNRLEIFRFGLSGENEIREINYNEDMSCGQSTILETREVAYKFYEQNKLISADNEIKEFIQVRKASEIIGVIIENHKEENIVLKIDCEGEEYSIFQNLSDNNMLEKIDFIMLEWHYKGKEILLHMLEQAGFSYWCSNKSKDMGLIYAYKQ